MTAQERQMQAGGRAPSRPMVAVRVDDDLGVREEVEFFGSEPSLFGCRHLPTGQVTGALVMCSPILSDFGANYAREVRLARRLAAAGIAVQRFHPRGSGHSDGSRVDLTFAAMVDDTSRAVDRLRQAVATVPIALLGTRFSALTAAAAVRALPGVPIALWEPVIGPDRFFRDGLRARSVYQLKRGSTPPAQPDEELAAHGYVDILGVAVGPDLLETSVRHGLEAEMGNEPRPVLLAQLDPAAVLRRPYREIVERWSASGFDVTVACCQLEETWWFVHDRLLPSGELIDTTVAWVLRKLGS